MKSAFFILVVFLFVGCTEYKRESKETVQYQIKTFFIGEHPEVAQKEPPKETVMPSEKVETVGKIVPTLHEREIYDSLIETESNSKTSNTTSKIDQKPVKTIELGEERIKIFDSESPALTAEEIERLRNQK